MAFSDEIGATNPEASILLIGDAGSKKTTFLGTIPEVFVYDFDAGMAVNRGRRVEYQTFKDVGYGVKLTQALKNRGFHKWGEAWPAFINHLNNTVGKAIDDGSWGHRPVALDSLTTLMNLAMNHVLREGGKKPMDAKSFNDWGQQIGLVETVLDQLTAWPVMLICTAHIHRDNNELMESVEYLPLLTGKFAGRVALYFDEVWYSKVAGKVGERKFSLVTESTGMYKQAKTRYNVKDGSDIDWSAVKKFIVQQ